MGECYTRLDRGSSGPIRLSGNEIPTTAVLPIFTPCLCAACCFPGMMASMNTKQISSGIIILLLLLSLACNASLGANRSDDLSDGGAELSQRADALATQAAAAATAAAETITNLSPSGSLAENSAVATAAAQTAVEAPQAGAALQETAVAAAAAAATSVASAAGAVSLPALNTASLAERFAALQFNGSGSYTVAISEADVNQSMQAAQAAGQETAVQSPAVQFSDGLLILTGVITSPDLGNMTVQLRPIAVDGALQFQVLSAAVGGINLPAPLLQTAESILNSTLGTAVNNLPAGVTLQAVTVSSGEMTLVVVKN